MVGYDGDGIVEPYELTHAPLTALAVASSTLFNTTAEHGRLCKGCDLHARRPNVDAIDSRSLTFAGVSRRLAGVPMSLKSSVRFTFAGTDMRAAAAASSPYLIRLPAGA
jgi:hypothetical protein